jgi:hypothetical protein
VKQLWSLTTTYWLQRSALVEEKFPKVKTEMAFGEVTYSTTESARHDD